MVFIRWGSIPNEDISFVLTCLYLFSDLSTPYWEVYCYQFWKHVFFICRSSVPSEVISCVFSFVYLYSDLSTLDWEVYVFSAGVQFPTGLFCMIIFLYLFSDGHNRLRSICFFVYFVIWCAQV